MACDIFSLAIKFESNEQFFLFYIYFENNSQNDSKMYLINGFAFV